MSIRVLPALAGSLALIGAQTARAADDEKPPVKIEGVLFTHFGLDLSEGADLASDFDVDRAYLTAKAKLDGNFSARLTLDVGREKAQAIELPNPADPTSTIEVTTPEEGKIRVFVKYAYGEWKPKGAPDLKLRFGAAEMPLPGYYDKFWGQRYVSKSFTDEFKILDTSDIGVHLLGKHADGLVDWQLALVNGEGYSNPEIDASKTAALRVTLDPLAKSDGLELPISAFALQEVDPNGGDVQGVYGGALGFSQDYILVWGEGMLVTEGDVSGTGVSATLMPRVPDILNVYGRFDLFDEDSSAEGDTTTRMLAGVSRQFNDNVQAALQYENTWEGDETGRAVTARMEVGF